MIDWNDKKAKISANFTVGEALYLPSWGVYHKPTEAEKENIIKLAEKMELVREYLGGNSINVSCWIRPTSVNCDEQRFVGKNYNLYVHGAQLSQHRLGKAVDFTVSRITCNEVRELLKSKLEEFGIRMENLPNSGWVHCDTGEVPNGGKRFFIP